MWIPQDHLAFLRFTVALIVGIAAALFLHDSGSTMVQALRIGTRELLLPLFLGLVLAYVLDPAVSGLERRGVRRVAGIAIVFGVLLLVLIVSALIFFPIFQSQLVEIRSAFPFYMERFASTVSRMQDLLYRYLGIQWRVDVEQELVSYFEAHRSMLLSLMVDYLRTFSIVALLVPLFSLFLLHDGRRLKRWIISNVPNRYFESVLIIFHRIDENLGNFIRGRFKETLMIGLLSQIGFFLIGLKYHWFFAILGGLTNLIPIVGPIFAGFVTCAFALLDSGDPVFVLFVASICFAIQVLDSVVLIPILVAQSASLHFMTGLLALLIGGKIAGVFGLVVAVPVVSVAKLVVQEITRNWKAHGILEYR